MQVANMSSVIVSGPTTQRQPPFQWSTSWLVANLPASVVMHVGQADLQAFGWINSLSLFPPTA
jgi:hypothetical protein